MKFHCGGEAITTKNSSLEVLSGDEAMNVEFIPAL